MIKVGQSLWRGRGVFALRAFEPNEIIEQAPVKVIPLDQISHVEPTVLDSDCYRWGELDQELAVVLGSGSLYNHSIAPNARYQRRAGELVMEFVATRAIGCGDKILINDNGQVNDLTEIVFEGETWRWAKS